MINIVLYHHTLNLSLLVTLWIITFKCSLNKKREREKEEEREGGTEGEREKEKGTEL